MEGASPGTDAADARADATSMQSLATDASPVRISEDSGPAAVDAAPSEGLDATTLVPSFDASSLQISPPPPGLAGFAFIVNGVVQSPLNCPNNNWVFAPPPAQNDSATCQPLNASSSPPPCVGITSVLLFNSGSTPLAYTAQATWDIGGTAFVPGVVLSGQKGVCGVLNPGAYVDITSAYVGELTALLGSSQPFSSPDAGKYVTDEGTIPWPNGVSGSDGATEMNVAQIDIDTACGMYTNLWR